MVRLQIEHAHRHAAQVLIEQLLLVDAQVHELGETAGQREATHDDAQLQPEAEREQKVVQRLRAAAVSAVSRRADLRVGRPAREGSRGVV